MNFAGLGARNPLLGVTGCHVDVIANPDEDYNLASRAGHTQSRAGHTQSRSHGHAHELTSCAELASVVI